MAKVVTLGEIMLRLSTQDLKNSFKLTASTLIMAEEANVAVSLSNYGHEGVFVTKVPDNPLELLQLQLLENITLIQTLL